ncbi:class IV adenylate cyclase [Pseudodesulfovibrio sediminis]|uniref:CYTH domain-containing protein n=1 Tax=Pseudodesulfovibrio sediminis TaxID=2810563 RepID=A0ABM7P2H3_9BACT|nr:class IV adenylate cyclase [Pseudodesulfovibrio sediminis]BCS86977.1 hypothetical protein PSDVSF_02190 [Pseudodesulfovibrio sediminis]
MVLECELKYLNVDLAATSRRLNDAEGEFLGKYFESNRVFDHPDRALKKAGTLLRLREKQGQCVLTVKRPPAAIEPSKLKIFEEIETGVDDCKIMAKMLEALGFISVFSYEKVREKWRFMDCVICLDRLPFGDFVEIEGTDATVSACAAALGLDPNDTTKATYHGLNIENRLLNGLEPDENFVFEEDVRVAICNELAKDSP